MFLNVVFMFCCVVSHLELGSLFFLAFRVRVRVMELRWCCRY